MNNYLIILIAIVPAILALVFMVRILRKQAMNMTAELRNLHEKIDEQNKEIGALERKLERFNQGMTELGERNRELKQKTGEYLKEERTFAEGIEAEVKELARKLTHLPRPEQASQTAANVVSKLDSPLVADVLQMLEKGIEPKEIARQKGIQVGEIELIKGLKVFASKEGSVS